MSLSPQEARAILTQAEGFSRRAAQFPLSWVGYSIMCAIGTLYLVCAYLTNSTIPIPIWVVLGIWMSVGIILSAVLGFFSGPVPRGFGTRWVIMMAMWSIVWVFTVTSSDISTAIQLIAFSMIYLGLAVTGPVWELKNLRNIRKK